MKSWKPEAIILAIGMLIMGYFIKNGLDTFAGKDRVVTVKGLAENGSACQQGYLASDVQGSGK